MVFPVVVRILIVVLGTVMYLVVGPSNGFTSIPVSMYWAVVTMTTTGDGDIYPKTPPGQCITSLATMLGYGVIACPAAMVGAGAVQWQEKCSVLSVSVPDAMLRRTTLLQRFAGSAASRFPPSTVNRWPGVREEPLSRRRTTAG